MHPAGTPRARLTDRSSTPCAGFVSYDGVFLPRGAGPRYADATDADLQAYNDDCAICRERMVNAKKLACGHIFHMACLRSWLSHQASCPICRRSLNPAVPSPSSQPAAQPPPRHPQTMLQHAQPAPPARHSRHEPGEDHAPPLNLGEAASAAVPRAAVDPLAGAFAGASTSRPNSGLARFSRRSSDYTRDDFGGRNDDLGMFSFLPPASQPWPLSDPQRPENEAERRNSLSHSPRLGSPHRSSVTLLQPVPPNAGPVAAPAGPARTTDDLGTAADPPGVSGFTR